MHPRTIGFDMKNIELTDKLPHVLEVLLNSMRSKYNYVLPDTLKKYLLTSVREYIAKLLNLLEIAQNDSCDDLIQHVNGLILLKRCDMLDQTVLETSAFTNGEKTVMQIFGFLVNEHLGELACKDLSARMIEYLRALMEFQFSLLSLTIEWPVIIIPDDTRSMMEMLVKLISDNTPVTSMDCTLITHGEHFLNTFKSVIFKYMLTHMSAITLVFDMLQDNPVFLLKWTEDLLLFLKRHRRELQIYIDAIVDIILQQFTCLKNSVFNVDSRKEILINIYSIAVHLKSKPTKITQNHEFYQWIRDQLAEDGLEYKAKILKNFFVCLTDVTDREDLQISLRTLKTNGRSLCSNLSEMSVNAMKVIDCFETLLVLLSTTKSMIMLKYVIHFAAGTGKRLFDKKLEEHLRRYYSGASLEHVLESLQQTYHAFMEVNITEIERLDILHGFLLPAFKFCDTIAIECFFEKNIQDLNVIATSRIPTNDDDAIKQKIVSKIGCFQLIAVMFARMNENKIDANKTIYNLNQVLVDKERYRNLLFSVRDIRSLRITRPGCQELMRLLHCSAYNCSLAIVSLKKDELIYSLAFGEDYEKKLFIWENIIDCGTQYKLGQTFKEYPKTREVTVNIKSAEVDRDERHGHAYVHSYDLAACTLSEDINAYDLNKCVVLPADFRRSASTGNSVDSNRAPGATSIALKSNDFNEHECMPYICVLLQHIRKLFKVDLNKPPKWLMLFLNVMQRQNNQNIQLFMLKIISNTADEVFKSYAAVVLTHIIKAVANYLKRYDLNYIITDILEILMDWHDVAVPEDKDGKEAAQKLFEVLVDKVLVKRPSDDPRVYKYNLNLIKTMIEKWRSCLRMPSEFLKQKMITAPAATVYLILILLNNGMTEEIVTRDDIVDFLLERFKDWEKSEAKETLLQCCECLGLYLRSLDTGEHDETERKKCEMKKRIFDILGSTSLYANSMNKQMKRVAALCRTYPEVATDYINVTLIAMAKRVATSYCLEIFALAMSRLSAEEIVNNLHHMDLQKILTNPVPPCEKMALQIVRDMVATVPPMDLLPYVSLSLSYIKDNVAEHRELVYDILMRIHKRYSADIAADNDATVQNLLSISVQNLLAGLLDPSPDLQDRILKFWTEETSLIVEKSKDRLIALLAMHSSWMTTERDAFAPFVALLMLQLATKSSDYTGKIFSEPLQDNCTFEEYRIAVSWRRRNLNCMTPMFVDSLASQMSYSTFSQSVDYNLYGTYMTPTSYSRLPHGIPPRLRATQDLQFEPTLLDDNDADISSHDPGFDRATIASSSRGPLMEHRRFTRILTSTSDVANNVRHQKIQNKVQRAERIKQENIRQRSSVRLYR